MRIYVDSDRCEGHGMCEAVAPQLIQVGDDELARVVVDDVTPELHHVANEAAMLCPKQALRIEDV